MDGSPDLTSSVPVVGSGGASAAAPEASSPEPETVSATRGGGYLVVASLAAIGASYLFLLASGRLLGSEKYGTLAALLGLLTVILLPTSALQMAVSRDVSQSVALGRSEHAAAFGRAVLRFGLWATAGLLLVAFALLVPLRSLLNIDSNSALALTLVALSTAFVWPIALGVVQGYERYRSLAWLMFAPFGIRLALLLLLALLGMRLYGALAAITLSALAATGLALGAIRPLLHVGTRVGAPRLAPFLRYLAPVVVGILAISILTNIDLLVVKARFSAHEAGIYGATSAFARVAFFLPATILSVLFPRTAARLARGEQAGDIVGRSLIVTFAFCAALAGFYALLGDRLVRATYGSEFAGVGSLLVLLTIAMGGFALLNVLVGYHLSRGESRFAWILAAGVVAQVALMATLPTTLRGVIWVDIAVAGALVLAHEVAIGSSVPALRSGLERLQDQLRVTYPRISLVRVRRILVEAVAVLGASAGLAVLITWPLARHLNSNLLGPFPNDAAGSVAFFSQRHAEGGYHVLGIAHHTLTGAPLGWDQGNALNLQWLVPYLPAYLVSGWIGEVAAFNLVILSGLALSAAAMYLLVRWLGCGRLVAGWAGLVFMVFPWHLDRALAGHGSLVHIGVFPLFVLAVLAWARRPTGLRLSLFGLACVLIWMTSALFAIMSFVALVGLVPAVAWHHRRIMGARVALLRASAISGTALFVGACLGALALSGRGSGGLGTARPVTDLYNYGARPRNFFWHLHGSASEIRVYVGWLTIALAVLWVGTAARGWKGRSKTLQLATVSLTAMTLVAAAFSLSDPLPILGHKAHPMPSVLLWKLSAEFRVPARLIAVVMTGLIPLAALGLQSLCTAARRQVRPRAAALALAAAICVAAGVVSYHDLVVPVIGTRVRRPPVYESLATTPAGVLAEYPLVEPVDWQNAKYVFWQRIHGRRLLNGAGQGTPADEVSRALVDPAARGTAGSLALLGVSAIITRPHTYDYRDDLDIKTPAPKTWGPGYRLVARFPQGVRLWRVTARPAPAVVSYATADFGLPAPQEHDFVLRSLTGSTGRIDLYAKRPGLWRLRLRAVAPHGRLALRLSGAASFRTIDLGARTAVSVPVLLPRGHSRLTVRVPQRARGDVALSNAWFVPAAGSDRSGALRPRLVSPRPGF